MGVHRVSAQVDIFEWVGGSGVISALLTYLDVAQEDVNQWRRKMDNYFYRRKMSSSLVKFEDKIPDVIQYEFMCPNCKVWGKITTEQLYGDAPIQHMLGKIVLRSLDGTPIPTFSKSGTPPSCKFNETIDLNIHGYEIVDATINERPATFWMGTDGLHIEFKDGDKEKVLYEGAYPSNVELRNLDEGIIVDQMVIKPEIQFEKTQ